MKTETSNIRKNLMMVGMAALLALTLPPRLQAAATVTRGEMTVNGDLALYTIPDDPAVTLLVEEVADVVIVSDSSGGTHILVKGIKEGLSATVTGTNFDYELVSHQAFSPNNIPASGRFSGTIHQSFTLIRIDPITSLPIALVEGEGLGHLTMNPDGEVIINVERMDWTVTPL